MKDFTLSTYRQLIETIVNSGYTTTNVHDHFRSPSERSIILRHDVDRVVELALKMASLEHEFGISATYYFRHIDDVFDPDAMRKIADMGHEVGFHYEVMDKAKGDVDRAIQIFDEELADFKAIVDVDTACMHGNPLASWSNRDLWEKNDFREHGIIGEPYLSIDYEKVMYLTDTGRTWADRNIRVKDVIGDGSGCGSSQFAGLLCNISSTGDVMELIRSEQVSQICLLVHPNRWCDNNICWTRELVLQNLKNIGKAAIIRYRKR